MLGSNHFSNFGTFLADFQTAVVFLYIYQVASMIVCFVRKNQSIAGTLTSFAIPAPLIIFLVGFLAVYTFSVVGMYFCSGITENEKIKFVEEVCELKI